MEKVAAASPHTPFSPYVAPRFPHMSEINSLFAMEKTALLQEDCEAAGLDLLEMQRHFLKTSLAGGDGPLSETLPLGEAEADGAARCAKCHVRAAITQPWGDGGGGGGGGGGEPMSDGPPPRRLCSVCSAEAALDAREPRRRHGQMEPKGASGFIGWTKGLRRTQDPKALRKMYQADRPDQIEKLEASISLELAEEEAADVDELLSDEEGEGGEEASDAAAVAAARHAAARKAVMSSEALHSSASEGSDSEDDAQAEAWAAEGETRLRPSALRRAWRAELRTQSSALVVRKGGRSDLSELRSFPKVEAPPTPLTAATPNPPPLTTFLPPHPSPSLTVPLPLPPLPNHHP